MIQEPAVFIKTFVKCSPFVERVDLIELAEIDLYNFTVKDFIDVSFTKGEDPDKALIAIYELLTRNICFEPSMDGFFTKTASTQNDKKQIFESHHKSFTDEDSINKV